MKSISDNLKYIKEKIDKKDKEAREIELSLSEFIKEFIPNGTFDDVVREFKVDKNKLFIYTKHKIFSQELELRMGNLIKLLPNKIKKVTIK